MPGARRVRKGQTGRGPNAQIKRGGDGTNSSGPEKYDGRENKRADMYETKRYEAEGKAFVVKE